MRKVSEKKQNNTEQQQNENKCFLLVESKRKMWKLFKNKSQNLTKMLLSRVNMSYMRIDIFDYCDSEFSQYMK